MTHNKTIFRLAVVGLLTAGLLWTISPGQAAEVTQAEYVCRLCEKLGLGEKLTCEQCIVMLDSVGIVPSGGWHCDHDVTCELVAEVQILVIKAAQMGLIRYTPEDTVILVSALSDELGCCPPPRVVEILPGGGNPPPRPITELPGGGGGGGGGAGTGGGSSSPSPSL